MKGFGQVSYKNGHRMIWMFWSPAMLVALGLALTGCTSGSADGLRELIVPGGALDATAASCDIVFPGAPSTEGLACATVESSVAEADAAAWIRSKVTASGVQVDEVVCNSPRSATPACVFFGNSKTFGRETMTATYVRKNALDAESAHWFNIVIQPTSTTPEEVKAWIALLDGS